MKVNFSTEHQNPKDCQLLVAITGSKEVIREQLQELISEIDSPYGKPYQGTMTQFKSLRSVITPVWNGKEY